MNKPVAFPYNCQIGINLCNFIVGCLKINEEERMDWKQVFDHPLVKNADKGPALKHTQVDKQLENILIRVQ